MRRCGTSWKSREPSSGSARWRGPVLRRNWRAPWRSSRTPIERTAGSRSSLPRRRLAGKHSLGRTTVFADGSSGRRIRRICRWPKSGLCGQLKKLKMPTVRLPICERRMRCSRGEYASSSGHWKGKTPAQSRAQEKRSRLRTKARPKPRPVRGERRSQQLRVNLLWLSTTGRRHQQREGPSVRARTHRSRRSGKRTRRWLPESGGTARSCSDCVNGTKSSLRCSK
mmetsp:Transcript_17238/g.65769  ORF Transcript_17238/g.65769 Transcript_17238/m.65769 type:complete len:225 (-) Transcript_17238:165-839(-)